MLVLFFFFNDTATTEIYTLSLHDALPIFEEVPEAREAAGVRFSPDRLLSCADRFKLRLSCSRRGAALTAELQDRKSTRLNSSHANISYAVFCLKKKKHNKNAIDTIVIFAC